MNATDFWRPHVGAVSLSFDDGRDSQLERAIPAMDERGLRGTFYLSFDEEGWEEAVPAWQAVSRAGHEIGNHSLSHTCSCNFGWGSGLEAMSLDEIEGDILAAQERLDRIAPRQTDWTYCYPCYQTFVGRGEGRRSYVPIVAKRFLAGRAGGESGFANVPERIDLAAVWGTDTQRMSGFEMIGLAEALTHAGQWVIFVFHEIDGPRLSVASTDFLPLLDYLHRKRDEIWTAPVAEVARKIADSRH